MSGFLVDSVTHTYPNSGAAVKCKRFDLSIFKKHLQNIWYQKQRVVFKHGLRETAEKKRKGRKQSVNPEWVIQKRKHFEGRYTKSNK